MRVLNVHAGRFETSHTTPANPEAIAKGIRELAHDLHATLKTAYTPAELRALEQRIDDLRVYTHGSHMVALDRWLHNTRSAIRSRALGRSRDCTV